MPNGSNCTLDGECATSYCGLDPSGGTNKKCKSKPNPLQNGYYKPIAKYSNGTFNKIDDSYDNVYQKWEQNTSHSIVGKFVKSSGTEFTNPNLRQLTRIEIIPEYSDQDIESDRNRAYLEDAIPIISRGFAGITSKLWLKPRPETQQQVSLPVTKSGPVSSHFPTYTYTTSTVAPQWVNTEANPHAGKGYGY